MPFISDTESRSQMQSLVVDDGRVLADWDEVYDASVGFAIDEGLSISRMLNNEMYEQRRDAAKVIFDNGEDRSKYTHAFGDINWDALSSAFPDKIKSNDQLAQEKRDLLARRRSYYEGVMARSDSTSAELLGSMNAFALDPINVLTMGIGTPFAIAKGVGVVDKAIRGALGAAAINAGTEALIQPLVLDYKLDIDSPYGVEDAIANIAMAAGGGLILGGTAGGISGWLGRIRGEIDKIEKLPDDIDVDELNVAINQIDEAIETLKANPEKVDIETAKASVIDDVKTELKEQAAIKLDRPERIKLESEKARLEEETKQAERDAELIAKEDSGVKLNDLEKAEVGLARVSQELREGLKSSGTIAELKTKIDDINKKLSDNEKAARAESELEALEKGDIPENIESRIINDTNEKQVESDANYLRSLEEERTRINRTPDEPEPVTAKEINDSDLEGVYNAMDKPKVIVDGDLVDAKKLIDEFDNDIEALEAMRVCLIA